MNVSILLLASGRGTRLGAGMPKAFVPIRGRPLVLRCLDRLAQVIDGAEVVLAVDPGDRARHVEPLADELRRAGVRAVVDGGDTRQRSMRNALAAASADAEVIVVHDAARPFLPIEATREVVARAAEVGAALLAVPAQDTLKQVDADGSVLRTVERASIWHAQTPQAIRRDRLLEALRRADADHFVGTDDVSLCEHAGMPVVVVPGDPRNLKVTTPDDLVLADAIATLEEGR